MRRTILIGAICFALGVAATLIVSTLCRFSMKDFGPPRVTLINLTGDEIRDITISLGQIKEEVPTLKDGQSITVAFHGNFSECSTQVAWTDSVGKHEESADDYMVNYGRYHSKIVLTPEKKAKKINEIE